MTRDVIARTDEPARGRRFTARRRTRSKCSAFGCGKSSQMCAVACRKHNEIRRSSVGCDLKRKLRVFFAEGEDEKESVVMSPTLSIRVGRARFTTYFFDLAEIEFTFESADVAGGKSFACLERTMIWLADVTGRRVILTMKASSEHRDIVPLLETLS